MFLRRCSELRLTARVDKRSHPSYWDQASFYQLEQRGQPSPRVFPACWPWTWNTEFFLQSWTEQALLGCWACQAEPASLPNTGTISSANLGLYLSTSPQRPQGFVSPQTLVSQFLTCNNLPLVVSLETSMYNIGQILTLPAVTGRREQWPESQFPTQSLLSFTL